MSKLVTQAAAAVKKAMEGEGSGHDWWHVWRVWRLAERVARTEPRADATVIALGALLHDLGDWKFHGGDEEAAPREAGRLLARLGAPRATIERVQAVCREVSYKGAGVADRPTSLEARVVQDADRLDAIGAIGVARTFAAYKKSRGHTINHFHEKLLLLKKRLHTREAKRIAKKRHAYLVEFLKTFHREWKGTD